MMKIITIIGARPQFVKSAVVSRAIAKWNQEWENQNIQEIIVHTGQHYDANMSEIFFDEMSIPQPKYNLHIGSGTHGCMTGRMLEKIEQVLLDERPDVVLVYGDTDSTLAGALAASKLHVPVAHVEAGLRSFNMEMPEEVNRILTDRISHWLFCPTQSAAVNLTNEGYTNFTAMVSCVGDVMYDAACFYRKQRKASEKTKKEVRCSGKFYLATVHRAENTDNPERIKAILRALDKIAEKISVILPVHPRTRKIIQGLDIDLKHINMVEPVGYFDMIYLLEHCLAVFTDSGGVQKEAFFFNKLCITLRDETEWVELVENGFNRLVGADYEEILQEEKDLRHKDIQFGKKLYGDGHAGEKIVQTIAAEFYSMK